MKMIHSQNHVKWNIKIGKFMIELVNAQYYNGNMSVHARTHTQADVFWNY